MENKPIINKGNYDLLVDEDEIDKKRAFGIERIYYEYRKLWKQLPEKGEVQEYPLLIDIELSTVCNLSCPFCYTITSEFKESVSKQFMDLDLFNKIIDEIADKVPAIRLSLRGEPTLHPHFIECIKYAKAKGIAEVSFLTNGSKLTVDFFEKILLAGADWITLSFDGLHEEYEKNRYPLKFDEMYNRLQEMKKIKERYRIPKPVIKIQSIWPAIEKEPNKFYDEMSKVCDMIAFNPLIDYHHIDDINKIEYEENFLCPMHYQRLVIGSDGNVMMCSNDENGEYIIGNAYKQTIYEIWHSDKLNEVRKKHKKKDGFKEISVCKRCYIPRKTIENRVMVNGQEIIIKNYK